MKRLVVLLLLSLFTASCWPTPEEQQRRNEIVGNSFRCMFAGDCAGN